MTEIRKVENKIESYMPEDVSILNRDKFPLKLRNIEARVKMATDALDAVMSDSKRAGFNTTKPSQWKSNLINLME